MKGIRKPSQLQPIKFVRKTENDSQSSFRAQRGEHNIDALNDLIHEYFLKNNLVQSIACFQNELNTTSSTSSKDYIALILDAFDRGNREEFFKYFNTYVPLTIRQQDKDIRRIEFYLQLHFLVNATPASKRGKMAYFDPKALSNFRKFLDQKGQFFSGTSEFVNYFGIHAVEKPSQHPSFKQLFERQFVIALRERLSVYLSCLYSESGTSLISDIYRKYLSRELEGDSEQLKKARQKNAQLVEMVKDLDQKYKNMAQKYRNLNELNKNNFIQSVQKWFSMLKETVALCDTFNNILLGHNPARTPELERASARLEQYKSFTGNSLEDLISGGKDPSIFELHSHDDASRSELNYSYTQSGEILDYQRIKRVVCEASKSGRNLDQACRILQAVRHRLTRAKSIEDKREAAIQFEENDLLALKDDKSLQLLLGPSANREIRAQVTRLMEFMGDDFKCREYMSRESGLMRRVLNLYFDPATPEQQWERLLNLMQYLSIRKLPVQAMLSRGVIQESFKRLLKEKAAAEAEGSPAAQAKLVQIISLILNLSLCQSGVRRCLPLGDEMLRTYFDLLESESEQLINCVNSALYSLFALKEFREKAKAIGMHEFLNLVLKNNPQEGQVKRILERLESLEEDIRVQETKDSDDYDNIVEGEMELASGREDAQDEEALQPFLFENRQQKERIKRLVEESLRKRSEHNQTYKYQQRKGKHDNQFVERLNSPQFNRHHRTSESVEESRQGPRENYNHSPEREQDKGKKLYENSKNYQEAFIKKDKCKRTPPEGWYRNH